jgi:bilirubin oxidase
MDVEPRKYRFRVLNAAVSRNFGLYFTEAEGDEDSKIPFHVISSDSGLLERPVQTSDLVRNDRIDLWTGC